MINQIKKHLWEKKAESLPQGGQKTALTAKVLMSDGMSAAGIAGEADNWLGSIAKDSKSTENEKKLASLAKDTAHMLVNKQLEKDNNTLTPENMNADNYKIAANIEMTALNVMAKGCEGPLAFSILKVGNEVLKNIKNLNTQDEVGTIFRNALTDSLGIEKGKMPGDGALGVAGHDWIEGAPDKKEAHRREKEMRKIVDEFHSDEWFGDIGHLHFNPLAM